MSTNLDALIQRTLRPDLKAMHAYAVQPSAGLVKLDTMENPYRLSPTLQDELGKRLGQVAINRYPAERLDVLRVKLAVFARMPDDCSLMLGNGSDEIITLLTMACANPQAVAQGAAASVMLSPMPSFVMYPMAASLFGMRFVSVPLTNDFELDEAAMLTAIEREQPALTFLAHPNNPTGTLWSATTIERVIEAAGRINGLVVMDEAYLPFSTRDSMPWLRQHPHVLVMRTMSKFGLAGVRIGYLMGRKALMHEIEKLRPPFNVSVLNCEAALFALEHADEFARQAAEIRRERDALLPQLQALAGVERVHTSQGNMILARVRDSAQAFTGMRERGVLVKNVSAMHPMLANHLRITVGTPDENRRMLQALRDSL